MIAFSCNTFNNKFVNLPQKNIDVLFKANWVFGVILFVGYKIIEGCSNG